LHAKPEDIKKYKGKFDEGWDVLRAGRIEKLKKSGLLLPGQTVSKKDPLIPEWNKLTYDEQKYWTAKMEVYAAMVDIMDQNIGRVLAKVKELKKDRNTMVVFLSDNGSDSRRHNPDPSKRGRVLNRGPIGTSGSFEYIERNWAYLNNAPLLQYKTNLHEGGICSPFIAWFPSKIKGGKIVQGVGHLIDLAPTFYELANINYPKKYNSVMTIPLAGKSLLPVLFANDTDVKRGEPIFWERAGYRAVWDGKWKLVSDYPSNTWELYNFEIDKGETKDVSKDNLDIVDRLTKAYMIWATQTGVVEYSSLR
jgi:arylsulfatase